MRDNSKKKPFKVQNRDKNNDKKMRFNYFTNTIQKKGENFLDNTKPYQLNKDVPRILREILQGRIDLVENAAYFANQNLSIALINFTYNRYVECNQIVTCMEYYINSYNTQGIQVEKEYIETMEKFRALYNIYSIININLNNFRYTNDTSHLLIMGNALRPYYRNADLLY